LNFGCKLLGPAHLRPRPKEFDIRTVRRIILVRPCLTFFAHNYGRSPCQTDGVRARVAHSLRSGIRTGSGQSTSSAISGAKLRPAPPTAGNLLNLLATCWGDLRAYGTGSFCSALVPVVRRPVDSRALFLRLEERGFRTCGSR
jgi:hypothetical protein